MVNKEGTTAGDKVDKLIKISFKNQVDRLKIIKSQKKQGNKFSKEDEFYLYFASPKKKVFIDGGGSRSTEYFKCESCRNNMRVSSFNDIAFIICSSCGGNNMRTLTPAEERIFTSRI